jgi:thiosulfate reductase cytochrome b subunit
MYARFERFWHWSQSLLILIMLVSGFEIHGNYQLLGFEQAVTVHSFTAWLLIGLWVFAWFWHDNRRVYAIFALCSRTHQSHDPLLCD